VLLLTIKIIIHHSYMQAIRAYQSERASKEAALEALAALRASDLSAERDLEQVRVRGEIMGSFIYIMIRTRFYIFAIPLSPPAPVGGRTNCCCIGRYHSLIAVLLQTQGRVAAMAEKRLRGHDEGAVSGNLGEHH
jgi:hypothetical protein